MISRDAEPIEHRPVYKRIDLGSPKPTAPSPVNVDVYKTAYERDRLLREGERLWRLVRQSAGDRTQEPEPPPAPAPEFPEWGGFC